MVDKITIDQEDYCQFSIYNSAGKKIQDITDNSGKKILEAFTGGHQAIPLYIDPNNNLYFAHKEFNDKNNLCNPNRKGGDYTNYFDIYKIQLIEQ